MNIIDNITNINYTKGNNRSIKYIVIHYVGAVSSAKANSNYFKSTYRGRSAHYFVDDNDIYRVVKDEDIAWHCGATYYKHLSCRNSNSIGIEMCCYNNNGKTDVSENVVNRTIELTKELMKKYNIPLQNVIRHYDVTGKNCPAPMVENSSRWINFIERIKLAPTIKSKYKVGQKLLADFDVKVAYSNGGEHTMVDSNGYQFWVRSEFVKNNKIHELVDVCYAQGDGLYIVQLIDKQFWCRECYLIDKY